MVFEYYMSAPMTFYGAVMGTMGHFFTFFLKSPCSEGSQRIHGFKSLKLEYYLWSDLSLCYLGDEHVVVAVQAGRQDVSDRRGGVGFAASFV